MDFTPFIVKANSRERKKINEKLKNLKETSSCSRQLHQHNTLIESFLISAVLRTSIYIIKYFCNFSLEGEII